MLPPTQTAFHTVCACVLILEQMEPERLLGWSAARTADSTHFALNVPQEIQVLGRYGIAFLLCNMYPKAK